MISVEEAERLARTPREERIASLYRIYETRLRASGAVDFDDLLLLVVRLFETSPATLDWYRGLWTYVLVDEYQDTNRAQYRIVSLLTEAHRNLCVVGDPDQSVYRWRGADLRNILDFEKDFPDCRVVPLEQNYRSTKQILRMAEAVIRHNTARKDKRLWTENAEGDRAQVYRAWDENEEAAFVARAVRGLRDEGADYRDVAVFYRTNAQSRVLEDALRRASIPYLIVGGVRFYERREVKDVVAYLRLLVNPRDDVAFRRAIAAPARGVGKTTLEHLDAAARRAGEGLLAACADVPAEIGAKPRRALEDLGALIARLGERRTALPLPALIDEVLAASGYRDALKAERTAEADTRLENLEELVAASEEFVVARELEGVPADLPAFLDSVSLVADTDELDPETAGVTLMTLHSAKGLEFPVVFLTGLEEGVFPHSRSMSEPEELEEERRLCYVGLTRARQRLLLSYALHRRIQGYGVGGALALPPGDPGGGGHPAQRPRERAAHAGGAGGGGQRGRGRGPAVPGGGAAAPRALGRGPPRGHPAGRRGRDRHRALRQRGTQAPVAAVRSSRGDLRAWRRRRSPRKTCGTWRAWRASSCPRRSSSACARRWMPSLPTWTSCARSTPPASSRPRTRCLCGT